VFVFERVEQVFEVGYALAWENEDFGGESVLEAIETDGVASLRRFGSGAFLRVFFVGVYLSFGCHGRPPGIAGGVALSPIAYLGRFEWKR
jgi:hypothetical protein